MQRLLGQYESDVLKPPATFNSLAPMQSYAGLLDLYVLLSLSLVTQYDPPRQRLQTFHPSVF